MSINILFLGLLFIWITVTAGNSVRFDPIAAFIRNPQDCQLNACEVLRILSQHVLTLINSENNRLNVNKKNENHVGGKTVDMLTLEIEIEKRVKAVERRLRSIEQPVWKLAEGSDFEWNHCEEGFCRCLTTTKSVNCWNKRLKTIPQAQTVPMDTLTIDLSSNQLSTLHKETFRGLTHLSELDLSHNVFDYIPHDLLSDLDGLSKLRLQYNNLEDLHHETFIKLRNLKLLDLSHNRLLSIPSDIFHYIYRLTVINLSNNKLKVFPADLLNGATELEDFDISKNELMQVQGKTFHNLGNLTTLDLSHNQISNISDTAFLSLEHLDVLNIRNNRLTDISSNLLRNLSTLILLDFSLNRINHIHPDAFTHLENLEELYLGQNSLQQIPGNLFQHQSVLKKLMIFSNSLTALANDSFIGLHNVSSLLLNNNILKDMEAGVFQPMKNLVKLRLDSNKLLFLPQNCLDNIPTLEAVKLEKNPWHCDCRAIYLARWLRSSPQKLWDGEPMCRGPGDLGGNPVGDLRYSDLCDGQWASMLSLSPRIPVRKITLEDVKSPFEYLQENFTNATNNKLHKKGNSTSDGVTNKAIIN